MEPELVADTTSGFIVALLEYGAMGLFCGYLLVSNWIGQKRLDRVMAKSENLAGAIAGQLSEQNAKLDTIIESKRDEQLKRDLARLIEDKER